MRQIIMALWLCCACIYAAAQSSAEADTIEGITLDAIIFSANRFPDSQRNIAQPVEKITSRDIFKYQSSTTADILGSSGSISIQKSQQGGGSPIIRGFEASRVLLVVDGIRMNNLIYRSGHLQNAITIDPMSLDHAEILFGPSSTMYGSDALGGVMHLYTKRAQFSSDEGVQTHVNFWTRYASANQEISNHADINFGTTRFASLTSISFSKYGDVMSGKNQNPFYSDSYGLRPFYIERIQGKDSLMKNDNEYLQVGSAFTQYNFMQKFAHQSRSGANHGLNLQFSTSTNVPRYDRLTDSGPDGLKYAEWYYGPQKRLLAAYDFNDTRDVAYFEKRHASLHYQQIEESRYQRKFGADNLQSRIEQVGVVGMNLDLEHSTDMHVIRIGTETQYHMLRSTALETSMATGASTPLDTRYPDGDNSMFNAALYFSHIWNVSDYTTITDGVRLGYVALHSTILDTSFFRLPYSIIDQKNPVYSGSIGITHTPDDEIKLSFLISTGFRVPNIDDLSKIFESIPGHLIVPNANLKPEKTINAEWGFTKIIRERTKWVSSIYYTELYNAIQTAAFQWNGQDSVVYDGTLSRVLANQNSGKGYIYGFSSALNSKLSESFMLSANANYTYGRLRTDSIDVPLDHVAPFMARIQLTYTREKFSSDLFVNYQAAKKLVDYSNSGEDNLNYATSMGMPAWLTLNWRVQWHIKDQLQAAFGVDNILDTQYRTFASGINAPGRNVIISLKASI